MVSKHDDAVDFDKLEKELTDALAQEQRYWTENDAKFRAVDQKVATYDEFRWGKKTSHVAGKVTSPMLSQRFLFSYLDNIIISILNYF